MKKLENLELKDFDSFGVWSFTHDDTGEIDYDHADKNEMLHFLKKSNLKIEKIALVHGEEDQILSFAESLKKEGFSVVVPKHGESIEIR